MFAYNPGVYDTSGEFLAKGALGAAQANQQMYEQIGEDVGGTIRKAGQAVAGFAMGGPAGAAMAMQGGGERGGSSGGGDGFKQGRSAGDKGEPAPDTWDEESAPF